MNELEQAVSKRYFFPRSEPLPAGPLKPVHVEVPGARLACLAADEGAPHTLLHFHGNGEVVADWVDLGPALQSIDLRPVFAEYRGYGASTGAPDLVAMLDDALTIADTLAPDPRKTFVYGRSVGSLYALHVAAHRPVAGLILESGIADVYQRLNLRLTDAERSAWGEELKALVLAHFDHRVKLAISACPVLVLHARNDHLVPVEHAEHLARWAGKRAQLEIFERGDHNSIHAYNGTGILECLKQFTS